MNHGLVSDLYLLAHSCCSQTNMTRL